MDVELRAIVFGEDGEEVLADYVAEEIGGDVADLERAIGIAIV